MTKLQKLPDINEVPPISEKDKACLDEIKEVLKKHNSISRFGVTLLHEHFEVKDNEILVERCNKENRTLTITPVKSDILKKFDYIETNWRMDAEGANLYCMVACVEDDKGRHVGHWPG